ncbi:MAG: hypothetical protein ACTSRS_06590 [Candidatus Helarchaeota archaeon]
MAKIDEIWIITENGIPLFDKSVEQSVDVLIFGGFLSAIQSFIKNSFKEERLDKLIMGDSKITFSFAEEYGIFVVIRTHKKIKDSEIVKYLKKIQELFLANYGEALQKEITDISIFQGFNKILEENLGKSLLEKRMSTWFSEL